jgi:peptidoglycan-associated lipoprotein
MKKMLLIVLVMSTLSGCLFHKKGVKDETGSYVLTDFPIEKFKESDLESEKQILKDVHFDYNKHNIKENNIEILKNIAIYLKNNKVLHILIEGHCDNRGSNEYNLALGEQRALSTRDYLIKNENIDANKIQTISYGEEKPLVIGNTEEAWKENRRAHFLVAKE